MIKWMILAASNPDGIKVVEDVSRKNLLMLILMAVCYAIIAIYVILISRHNMRKTMEKQAYFDSVIGYSNYAKFLERTAVMLKYRDTKYAIGFVDISNFKAVNDYYGRDKGNAVLKLVADRVHDIVMPDGVFARLYADRFVFMVSYLDIDSLTYVVNTYLSEMKFEIKGGSDAKETIRINCNCGIYRVEDYKEDVNAMVDKASMALKITQQSISQSVTVLDPDVSRIMVNNQRLTNKMHSALLNKEFVAYIQPKISFKTGKIVGGEALVRWMSSDEGMIPPDNFIPLFEHNGFVANVDFFMLETICELIKKRNEWGKRNVPISVNQSRVHVYDSMYINKLINTIDRYGIEKDSLVFELTESAFTENANDMIDLIKRMSLLGYKISMDDFGCGYSSLNMLNLLPISELKLDKQFLDNSSERSRFIIKTIVNLAHGLGMTVVCEGVETDEQVRFLRQIGCDIAQGYYYAKPVPMPEFEKMLDNEYSQENKTVK
ncbi:MAG: putative bifunctional diguanylate cyclase/phosphodiesterase [Butyrivibrio sp.]